ncbi:excinuclease ABC subunit C [Photobacterium aphoticum]|uniref:Excinuclease ABC subunit C n=1 Tax=Photobacterium aphoticum TaxID=754436 RepID=A0A090QQY1_9GAMM|nr:excinuclease ABC subunit C [Photobacterium aphoticum]
MAEWPKRSTLIGVAKGTTRKPGLETLIMTTGEEFSMPSDSPALHLIQHIRMKAIIMQSVVTARNVRR